MFSQLDGRQQEEEAEGKLHLRIKLSTEPSKLFHFHEMKIAMLCDKAVLWLASYKVKCKFCCACKLCSGGKLS